MPLTFERTGQRLGVGVLVYVLCTILVVTLNPLRFQTPDRLRIAVWGGWFDVLTNVALFMIPGFLYALTRLSSRTQESFTRWRRSTLLRSVVMAAVFSTTIECIQLFEPARYPSPIDVVANTAGAVLGAAVLLRFARHLRADTPLVGVLALELPLMGLVYLALPVSMLAALTIPRESLTTSAPAESALALVSLAVFVGVLVGHVQRHGLGPRGLARPSSTALIAAAAFAAGTLPAASFHPLVVAAGAIASGTCAVLIGAWRFDTSKSAERRFEATALRWAAPFLLLYLALSSAASSRDDRLSRSSILDDVETYAAFTVLGYLLAEWWGRRELRLRGVLMSAGGVCFIVALLVAYAHTSVDAGSAALTGALVRALAGAYGGLLYHLQRSHVRALAFAQRAAGTQKP